MIEQDYEALVYYSNNLEEEVLDRKRTNIALKHETIDFAIIEALWFQIIIKACSFLDEWDNFLGVLNEDKYKARLKLIKQVVSPARRAFKHWKEIRKFRNEITAHNFRDKKHVVTIDKISEYNCPQSVEELYYLVSFLSRMIHVLTSNFPSEIQWVASSASAESFNGTTQHTSDNLTELKNLLSEIDNVISERVWDIPRFDILDGIKKSLGE